MVIFHSYVKLPEGSIHAVFWYGDFITNFRRIVVEHPGKTHDVFVVFQSWNSAIVWFWKTQTRENGKARLRWIDVSHPVIPCDWCASLELSMRTSSSNFASNCRMLDRNCCRISLIPWLHVVLLCIPASQLIDIFQPGEGVVPRAPEQCSCLAVDVRTPPPAQCCLHIHSRGPWKSSCQGLCLVCLEMGQDSR